MSDHRLARLSAGYAAILFILPYLALKIAWLTGNAIGFNDASLVGKPGMIFANAISFAMDFVAVGLALTFAHRWGLRVPAWLVLFPIWVATGFLIPLLVFAPIALISQLPASHSPPRTESMLQPWVGAVVAASFTGQGAALVVAFLLYARTRWASLLQSTINAAPARPVQVILAGVAALLASTAGALHLVWAFGGTVGLGTRALSEPAAQAHPLHGIWGLMSIVGAVGILAMVQQWGRAPFKLVLALTWIGAGSLFAWGLWSLIFAISGITLSPRAEAPTDLQKWLSFVKFTAGALIGLLAVNLVAERQAAVRRSMPARAFP